MSLYLSRLSLARDPQVSALNALLDPAEPGARSDAHHRLIWSAFAGDPSAPRDFLWRAEGGGRFMVLSPRPPTASPFFDPPETKAFDPQLAPGDRLGFVLRANATKDRSRPKKDRGEPAKDRRVDIVMDALHSVPSGQRAEQRMDIAQQVGPAWLEAQGARRGFVPQEVVVRDYSVAALPSGRGSRKGQPQFGILDMTGVIEVTDPAAFLPALARGFGRAKAFGCGLMLIRRV